jgi:hypothetical protein
MVKSQDQNAGQNHNIKNDNKCFERAEQFKYLGTTIMNQNFIEEEIKCSLKSGNACNRLVQNLLSSSLLSKNIKIKIYRTIIFVCILLGISPASDCDLPTFRNPLSVPSSKAGCRVLSDILPVVLYGCDTWSLTLREECRLEGF